MMRAAFTFLILIACFFVSCSPNNVQVDNSLKQYFDENKVEGCFALMDNGTGQFTVYNLARYRDSSYSPASTFKIVNSLIGLQTGVISSDTMLIKWDGIQRPFESWNKDLTMKEAFRASAVPYYQEVARRIGKDSMEHWLNRMKYGAKTDTEQVVIRTAVETFWLDNSLTVTPDQQLGLVKNLYFDQLPFFKTHQEAVKSAMIQENTTAYELAYKTGWAFWNEKTGKQMGWMVGWIKENKHPFFFVLNIESTDRNFDMANVRTKMLKDILTKLGFMQGKM